MKNLQNFNLLLLLIICFFTLSCSGSDSSDTGQNQATTIITIVNNSTVSITDVYICHGATGSSSWGTNTLTGAISAGSNKKLSMAFGIYDIKVIASDGSIGYIPAVGGTAETITLRDVLVTFTNNTYGGGAKIINQAYLIISNAFPSTYYGENRISVNINSSGGMSAPINVLYPGDYNWNVVAADLSKKNNSSVHPNLAAGMNATISINTIP